MLALGAEAGVLGADEVFPARVLGLTEVAREAGASYVADAEGKGVPERARPRGQAWDRRSVDVETALAQLRAQVVELTASVPERTAAEDVAGWLDAFRRVEGAVAGLRAQLVACAQTSRAAETGGHASTTSLLRDHLGLSGREAGRQDRLARDLRDLPGTRAALQAGELGPEQAQAIGRAARRGVLGDAAATEQALLPEARRAGADELRRTIQERELAADRDRLAEDERLAHRRRRASLVRRQDGMWDLHALLPGEDGEALATAIDAHRTFDGAGTPTRELRTPEQRTADALSDVIRAALGGPTPTRGAPPPRLSVVVPIELLVPEGQEGADGGPPAGDGASAEWEAAAPVAWTARGGLVSRDLVERLLCDAELRGIVRGERSRVLDVGRKRQTWTVAQRQALLVRDGGCRGPGCDRPAAWCDAHHVRWWSRGGSTAVDNGILLCRVHHRLVHEGGWTLRLDPESGQARFRSPRGEVVVTEPRRPVAPGRAPP